MTTLLKWLTNNDRKRIISLQRNTYFRACHRIVIINPHNSKIADVSPGSSGTRYKACMTIYE